jgi:CheY-like chemotaxis protein
MNLNEKIIMLIDDDKATMAYNVKIVSDSHAFDKIIQIKSPDKALEYLKASIEHSHKLPDLLLVDVNLPEMDGFELIDTIDELLDDENIEIVPIFVMLTSFFYKRDFEKFEKTPYAKKFLSKPLDRNQFSNLIKEFNL